jgi:hypothetical protein
MPSAFYAGSYMASRGYIVSFCLPLGILFLSGCLIPYAYPNLAYVPGCELGTQMPDCHVFRLDVTAYQSDLKEDGKYTVVEIPRRSDGSFPLQLGFSVDRGIYIANPALSFNTGCLHSTRVRIYRPGYQLIELKPWDSTDKVQWQPAVNWIEQEKAIDALLQRPAIAIPANPSSIPTNPWAAGYISCNSTEHFVAAECERLAALAPTPEDAVRVRNKAKELRTTANTQ